MNLLLCNIKQGQTKNGVQLGSQIIYNHIKKYNYQNVISIKDDAYAYQKIYNESILYNSKNILSIGGDHSIGAPTVMASHFKYGDNLKVIWIDAHADINTYDTSISKNKHGMPVAPLFGLMKPYFNIKNHKLLKPSQFVYIGLRNLDEPEKKFIKLLGIETYFMCDIKNMHEIHNIMYKIIKNNQNKFFHLSFDIDAIDPKFCPSTGTAENHGLTMEQSLHIINALVYTNKLKSYDLVEFNPLIGSKKDINTTTSNCVKLIQPYLENYA